MCGGIYGIPAFSLVWNRSCFFTVTVKEEGCRLRVTDALHSWRWLQDMFISRKKTRTNHWTQQLVPKAGLLLQGCTSADSIPKDPASTYWLYIRVLQYHLKSSQLCHNKCAHLIGLKATVEMSLLKSRRKRRRNILGKKDVKCQEKLKKHTLCITLALGYSLLQMLHHNCFWKESRFSIKYIFFS